jgi:hypothetical protein
LNPESPKIFKKKEKEMQIELSTNSKRRPNQHTQINNDQSPNTDKYKERKKTRVPNNPLITKDLNELYSSSYTITVQFSSSVI